MSKQLSLFLFVIETSYLVELSLFLSPDATPNISCPNGHGTHTYTHTCSAHTHTNTHTSFLLKKNTEVLLIVLVLCLYHQNPLKNYFLD